MSNLYSRRQIIKQGLVAGFAAYGLASCEAGSPLSLSTFSPVGLHMIFWGSATRNQLTQQAIKLFQQRYPDVTIASEYHGFNIMFPTLDKEVAENRTPDLIQMDMRYVSKYVKQGLLLNLTDLIYNQAIDLSDFDPQLLNSCKANNTVYGIPLGGNYQCMYYDKLLLARAGRAPFSPGASWTDFAKYAIDLSRASIAGVYGTSDSSGDITTFEVWTRSHGKELYTHDGNLNLELQDVVDWYSYWSDLRKAGGCLPAKLQMNLDVTGTPVDSSVNTGKAISSFFYSNLVESYQKAASHPLGIVLPPVGSVPGVYLKTSQMMSIAASSKYSTESANFINFILNDPKAVRALGIERGVPGSARARAVLSPRFTAVEQEIIAYNQKAAQGGNSRPKEVLDPPGAGQVATILKQISQEIGLGKSSVTDGAKTFLAQAQMALL